MLDYYYVVSLTQVTYGVRGSYVMGMISEPHIRYEHMDVGSEVKQPISFICLLLE